MIENGVTDFVVEQAVFARLESLGYTVKRGRRSRENYGEMVTERGRQLVQKMHFAFKPPADRLI